MSAMHKRGKEAQLKEYIKYLLLILILFAADQYTKWLISINLKPWQIKPVSSFLNLVHARNTGMVFGFLSGIQNKTVFWIITIASLMAAIFVVYLFIAEESRFARFSLSLIIAGAAGNLYDRLAKGYVTDFLDFHLKNHHWASFNLADSFITVGSLLLILYFLLGGDKNVSSSV